MKRNLLGTAGRREGFEVGEGFGEAGIGKEMPEPGIDPIIVLLCPIRNFPGNLDQGGKVARIIPVAPSMVCDDGFPVAEQLDEFFVHG